MNSIANPLAPRRNRLQEKSAEIKVWVRQLLDLSDQTHLSIAELACRDENCPDLETVIGIFEPDTPARTIRVHLPMFLVTRESVEAAVSASNEQ